MYLFATSHSPAAMKSSKTTCLCARVPALCHASPYSPPPRRFASATIPPCSTQATCVGAEPRCHRDPEAAVSGEEQSGSRRRRGPLLRDEEERDLGSVLARVKDLLRLERGGVEWNRRRLPERALAARDVVPVDRARGEEARERVKKLLVLRDPSEAVRGADPGERHVADLLPLEVVRRHGALGVLERRDEELARREAGVGDRVGPGGDDLLPRAPRRRPRVDGDDPLVGSVERGLHVEDRPLVAEDLVLRIEDVDEGDRLRRGLREVEGDELFLPPVAHLAVADRDDQVMSVVGNRRLELPGRVVRPLVHEDVLRRRRADHVEVDLAVVIGLGELLPRRGSGEAAVVDPLAVVGERGRVVLDVLELVAP